MKKQTVTPYQEGKSHKDRIRKANSILYSSLEACLKYIVYFEKMHCMFKNKKNPG